MSHLPLLIFLCLVLYLAECLLWVRSGEWLFLTWSLKFSPVRGPALRFRNPWPSGYAFRFRPFPGRSATLSGQKARARWKEFRGRSQWLSFFSQFVVGITTGMILIFFFLPLFYPALSSLLLVFALAHFSIAPLFWRAYGKLYPGKKTGRLQKTFLCLVSPWQSSRAVDLLADPLLEEFHPLVAAKLLLKKEPFLNFVRHWILEVRYPDLVHPEKNGLFPLRRSTAGGEEKELIQWFKGLELDPAKSLDPLAPSHPSHQSYCPRCEVEYSIPTGTCHDCGQALVPFDRPLSQQGFPS